MRAAEEAKELARLAANRQPNIVNVNTAVSATAVAGGGVRRRRLSRAIGIGVLCWFVGFACVASPQTRALGGCLLLVGFVFVFIGLGLTVVRALSA